MAKKKGVITTPHDAFFHSAMSDPRVSKAFFSQHLPQSLKQHVDLDSLKIEAGSFIDEELRRQTTDMLFSLTWKDKPAYLYTLVEHQRKPERLMAFRSLKYRIRIMDHHLKQTGNLPLVFVVVVYNGDSQYPYSTDLFDLFDADKEVAKELLNRPFELIDLTQIADETLKQEAWLGILELSLKHCKAPDLLPFLEDAILLFKTVEQNNGAEYIKIALTYLLTVSEVSDLQALRVLLHHHLSHEQEEYVMSFAQQMKQEGRQEGRQEGQQEGWQKGRQEGRQEGQQEGWQKGRQETQREMALRLIEANIAADEQIAELVGLPYEEVKRLITLHRQKTAH